MSSVASAQLASSKAALALEFQQKQLNKDRSHDQATIPLVGGVVIQSQYFLLHGCSSHRPISTRKVSFGFSVLKSSYIPIIS
jgi:hypothetical protein